MGDGRSIVGVILSVLTIRTTYYDAGIRTRRIIGIRCMMRSCLVIAGATVMTLVNCDGAAGGQGALAMTGDHQSIFHIADAAGFSKRTRSHYLCRDGSRRGFRAPLLARVDDASALLLAGQLWRCWW